MTELLTVREVAEYLKLNRVTVMRKAGKGEIPAIKIGRQFRFDKQQIDAWLENKAVGKKSHILVIDDEPIIGQLMTDSLSSNGCQVISVLNSKDGLELVAREHFDFIFLDLVMSQLNGFELFKRIRAIDNNVPIAIITGYPDSSLIAKVMELGPFLVFKKPLNMADIKATIDSQTRRGKGL